MARGQAYLVKHLVDQQTIASRSISSRNVKRSRVEAEAQREILNLLVEDHVKNIRRS